MVTSEKYNVKKTHTLILIASAANIFSFNNRRIILFLVQRVQNLFFFFSFLFLKICSSKLFFKKKIYFWYFCLFVCVSVFHITPSHYYVERLLHQVMTISFIKYLYCTMKQSWNNQKFVIDLVNINVNVFAEKLQDKCRYFNYKNWSVDHFDFETLLRYGYAIEKATTIPADSSLNEVYCFR